MHNKLLCTSKFLTCGFKVQAKRILKPARLEGYLTVTSGRLRHLLKSMELLESLDCMKPETYQT
jgi:hypothetical protein